MFLIHIASFFPVLQTSIYLYNWHSSHSLLDNNEYTDHKPVYAFDLQLQKIFSGIQLETLL